ncbi:MAG: methylase involved in ubiquinone/menaquinone biosynthesis [Gemmatimonadetes bacterium]|nr:methylase involved in ubiquinone/menaquinone biosynthesis [Gemmatimonadota bacterium]
MTPERSAPAVATRARVLKRCGLALGSVIGTFGFSPRQLLHALQGTPRFIHGLVTYRSRARHAVHPMPIGALYPILTDYRETAGVAEGHYFHQDLWAARRICAAQPEQHLDVGSRVDGFVSHVLCFMPVSVVDVRPLVTDVEGLSFVQCDATTMAEWPDSSLQSLSSLHAVEHFGLGRYGDPIDPDGPFKAMAAFSRVLRPGGRLYFSVPIGRERVEYNAHRIFDPLTILDTFERHGLRLVAFSAVDDLGHFVADASPNDFRDSDYSCGLFELTKGPPTAD